MSKEAGIHDSYQACNSGAHESKKPILNAMDAKKVSTSRMFFTKKSRLGFPRSGLLIS
jgi:hypothetical protein